MNTNGKGPVFVSKLDDKEKTKSEERKSEKSEEPKENNGQTIDLKFNTKNVLPKKTTEIMNDK